MKNKDVIKKLADVVESLSTHKNLTIHTEITIIDNYDDLVGLVKGRNNIVTEDTTFKS
jgi:hypothetical protein